MHDLLRCAGCSRALGSFMPVSPKTPHPVVFCDDACMHSYARAMTDVPPPLPRKA